MGLLQVLHGNASARDRIRQTANLARVGGHTYVVRFLSSWQELSTPRMTGPLEIIIFDAYWSGELEVGRLEAMARRRRGAALLVYSDFSSRPAADVVRLHGLGFERILSLGIDDDPRCMISALDAAAAAPRGRLISELCERLSPAARRIIRVAAELSEGAEHSPEVLAAKVGFSRRSLERRCARLGLPAPRRVLDLCRSYRAVTLLADTGRSITNIAFTLGYSDESTMRRTLRRMVGKRPSELRDPQIAFAVQMQIIGQLEVSNESSGSQSSGLVNTPAPPALELAARAR